MWILFGLSAIAFAFGNLLCAFRSADAKWFRFASLSFTALTVCAFYRDGARRVLAEDWSGLMDTMPTGSRVLLFCVLSSILINSISLLTDKKR